MLAPVAHSPMDIPLRHGALCLPSLFLPAHLRPLEVKAWMSANVELLNCLLKCQEWTVALG